MITLVCVALGCSNSLDAGHAKEAAAAEEQAEYDDSKGDADGGVDAVFDRGEDSHQNTSQEDDNFEGRHAPELEDDGERRDDIADGVDDDGRKSCVGNVKEESRQSIQSQQNDNRSDDTGKGRAHTGLGLDGGTREGSSGGIGTEEGTEQVSDADGDEFLGRVDDVVVDSAKGFGDGNVLDQHDDDGGGEFGQKGLDDGVVDLGSASVLEAYNSCPLSENDTV